jgi:hypothetical protein
LNDYRLEGLSPRIFEHLVQALAQGEITSTVTPFGDGPDGGREAAFDGETHYREGSSCWAGTGVIQAKFLSRPRDSKRDGAWIRSQLDKELTRYGQDNRQLPDYYILATNVTLTPASGGTKDAIINILKKFVRQYNLKGFDIWDYDKLRVFLDRNTEIRRSYAAWITPGDVLYELAEHLKGSRRDYYKLINKYLQRELLSDQYAKLEQAGHSGDDAIPLAQVFIDLPTTDHPLSIDDPVDTRSDQLLFVRTTIEDAGLSFKPSQLSDAKTTSVASAHRHSRPGRYVLIGGPGQGKTTIGQFICQIFRAALLQDVPKANVSPDVMPVAEGFRRLWEQAIEPQPRSRRIPYRVVLSEFAKDLAAGKTSSVL